MDADTGEGRALASNPAVVLLAIVALAGAAIAGMTMAESGPPPADEILADAEERYAAADTIVGSATVTIANETENRSAEVAFVVTDDNQSRLSITARNRTIVVGSNGTVGWVHDERTGLTRSYEIPEYNESANATRAGWNATAGWNGGDHPWKSNHSRDAAAGSWNGSHEGVNETALKALLWDWTPENTTAERVGSETVEGIEAHVIEIEPEAGRRNGTLTLLIGTENETLRKAEFAHEDRSLTVTFEEVRFNVSVADSTFDPPGITPPEGATIADSFGELNASTPFDLPRLPEEYAFTSGSTVVYGNATAAIQGYGGPANVTLVTASGDGFPVTDGGLGENATTVWIAGVNATVAETDRGVAVSWTEDGLRHALLSDRSRAATIELAEAVIGGD